MGLQNLRSWFDSTCPCHLSLKLQTGKPMKYVYILYGSKSDGFYFGITNNVEIRIKAHNNGIVRSTAPYAPWVLVWYGAFDSSELASDFERYLKSGSGKAFAYKRLIKSGVSRKMEGTGSPKSQT